MTKFNAMVLGRVHKNQARYTLVKCGGCSAPLHYVLDKGVDFEDEHICIHCVRTAKLLTAFLKADAQLFVTLDKEFNDYSAKRAEHVQYYDMFKLAWKFDDFFADPDDETTSVRRVRNRMQCEQQGKAGAS